MQARGRQETTATHRGRISCGESAAKDRRVVSPPACEVGPVHRQPAPKAEQTACRSVGNEISRHRPSSSSTTCWIMAARPPKLGKNIGDRFPRGQDSRCRLVLAFRRGNDGERKVLDQGAGARARFGGGDLDHAIGPDDKTHRALEDTISRAQHYGAMAVDALALFPASPMKTAAGARWVAFLSGALALDERGCHPPAKGGDPVRRGFSVKIADVSGILGHPRRQKRLMGFASPT